MKELSHRDIEQQLSQNKRDVDSLVPVSISKAQGKTALFQAGLLDQVEALIASARATDPEVGIAWDDAAEWHRSSSLINSLATYLGWSKATVDQLFVSASSITF
jgi:hypothetical protein